MKSARHKFDMGPSLASVGRLFLISLFVLQFMVSAVSASPLSDHSEHQEISRQAIHCDTHVAVSVEMPEGMSGNASVDENATHCIPSMCCFHDTIVSYKLSAIGVLLPSSRLKERGTAWSSHSGSKKDRPPKHV
jgi:hypothetical protein